MEGKTQLNFIFRMALKKGQMSLNCMYIIITCILESKYNM